MATTKKVILGVKAEVFHDQTTGVTVRKGEVKELNMYQLNSKRIRNAIQGGHLVYTSDEQETHDTKVAKEENLKRLKSKLTKLKEKGIDPVKASEAFTFDDLKSLAESMDIEVEENDTKVTIVTSLYEGVNK